MTNADLDRCDEDKIHKLASLGIHAANLVHELNNPLNAVQANLTILDEYAEAIVGFYRSLEQIEMPETLKTQVFKSGEEKDLPFIIFDLPDLVKHCRIAAGRALEIIKTMRDFSRGGQGESERIDVCELVEDNVGYVKRLFPTNAEFTVKTSGTRPRMILDRGKMNQILVNILINACQAVPEGSGKVEIEISESESSLFIAINDNGHGMDRQGQALAFEPFFTTRGGGTGLGLYICKRFVESLMGSISLHSRMNGGSTVKIELPKKER